MLMLLFLCLFSVVVCFVLGFLRGVPSGGSRHSIWWGHEMSLYTRELSGVFGGQKLIYNGIMGEQAPAPRDPH